MYSADGKSFFQWGWSGWRAIMSFDLGHWDVTNTGHAATAALEIHSVLLRQRRHTCYAENAFLPSFFVTLERRL